MRRREAETRTVFRIAVVVVFVLTIVGTWLALDWMARH